MWLMLTDSCSMAAAVAVAATACCCERVLMSPVSPASAWVAWCTAPTRSRTSSSICRSDWLKRLKAPAEAPISSRPRIASSRVRSPSPVASALSACCSRVSGVVSRRSTAPSTSRISSSAPRLNRMVSRVAARLSASALSSGIEMRTAHALRMLPTRIGSM
ncbi:hypothetical protein D3C78_1483630 [compost metagenome]